MRNDGINVTVRIGLPIVLLAAYAGYKVGEFKGKFQSVREFDDFCKEYSDRRRNYRDYNSK